MGFKILAKFLENTQNKQFYTVSLLSYTQEQTFRKMSGI